MEGSHRIVITRKCVVDIKDNVITNVYPETISVSNFVESNTKTNNLIEKYKLNIIDAFKRFETIKLVHGDFMEL